ncbi:MAG: hypothetical protein LBI57_06645 [Helicobacteraceae bacterium]|jgi:hypothetical protein|nr:hypothetical protein [Helicobacteraceae bacterium]
MRAALFAVLAICLFGGCVPYSSGFAKIENHLRAGDEAAALRQLENDSPADRDRVVFELDRAMLLQRLDRFKESAEAFESAKLLFDEYDAISVSEQVASMLINDGAIAYGGEDFERVLASFYAAINYLLVGDLYGARVEVMQGDERLKRIGDGKYIDDAALRYLSGIVFESLGENAAALVSYRQAYRVYKEGFFGTPLPNSLKNDLLRLSKKLGVTQEYNQYRSEFGSLGDLGAIGGAQGELIAIVGDGFAPIKRADEIMVGVSGVITKISVPRYEVRYRSPSVTLAIDGEAASCETIENVSAIALETLKANMPEIIARTIARLVAKKATENAIGSAAGGKDNGGAGAIARLAASLFNAMTEVADTRGWYTLPDSIYIARARLAQGAHRVTIGAKEYNVEIKSGERLFIAPRLY